MQASSLRAKRRYNLPANLEISPAAVIDPNSTTIISPAAALAARRITMLFDKLHPAARIRRAVVLVHIIR